MQNWVEVVERGQRHGGVSREVLVACQALYVVEVTRQVGPQRRAYGCVRNQCGS
jgi:hypothetical protein